MGNRQSVEITRLPTEHNEKNVQNGGPNGHAISDLDLPDAVSSQVSIQQNTEPPAAPQTNHIEPATVEVNTKQESAIVVSVEAPREPEISAECSTPAKGEPPKPAQTASFFKLFTKKNEPVAPAAQDNVSAEEQIVPEDQSDSQKSEPPDIKGSAESEKEPQGELLDSSTTEVTEDSAEAEEINSEENPVMNFFKTLVSPTKSKEVAAVPDASNDQPQKETPTAPAPNEASKVPPPPPPAPPKMESKAEPAIKKEEVPTAEAAAAKEQETPSKAKAKDSPFGKLFRPKSGVKEEAHPVEVQMYPRPAPLKPLPNQNHLRPPHQKKQSQRKSPPLLPTCSNQRRKSKRMKSLQPPKSPRPLQVPKSKKSQSQPFPLLLLLPPSSWIISQWAVRITLHPVPLAS
ncbi:breast carcinoma-amplified sequence 1 isoform X2 [Hoplias malabaricus]|uniref:breast carcinoma-amplified sequence 1 isoform X2 n=1 Tax=Hoplias malabaricus TaxID=27720 RepID=UPI003461DAA9